MKWWMAIPGMGLVGALVGGVAVASGSPSVTLHVPGARTIAVYCGGDGTVHADGTSVTFDPETPHCYLEAPLTAVMPLRGEFHVGGRTEIRCRRDNMRLICD